MSRLRELHLAAGLIAAFAALGYACTEAAGQPNGGLGADAQQRSPDSAATEELRLFHMTKPTPKVRTAAHELGFEPMPLINQWRFYDSDTGGIDVSKYQQKIWTPRRDTVPGSPGWEEHGAPAGFDGWLDLDFEKWDPILHPDNFDEQTVTACVNAYKNLVAATRRLRPNAKVCIHGLPRGGLGGRSGQLVEEIVTLCDAVSPALFSIFKQDMANLEQQLNLKRTRLEAALELKDRHGLKVFPVVWKRHRVKVQGGTLEDDQGRQVRLLTPPEVLRATMDVIFSTELDGRRVDGVIVWANDNRVLAHPDGDWGYVHPDTPDQHTADETDLQFFRIIAESAVAHGLMEPDMETSTLTAADLLGLYDGPWCPQRRVVVDTRPHAEVCHSSKSHKPGLWIRRPETRPPRVIWDPRWQKFRYRREPVHGDLAELQCLGAAVAVLPSRQPIRIRQSRSGWIAMVGESWAGGPTIHHAVVSAWHKYLDAEEVQP